MGFSDFLFGTPAGIQQVPRYNQQQQGARQQILSQSMQGLQNPTKGFEPIAQQARSQFNQQTVPSLAERFTSMGGYGSGALSSPAFASQLGQAGSGLEEGLAALQAQYGLQNQGQLMQLLGMGLSPDNDTYQTQGQSGFLSSIFPTLGRVGMHALGAGLTGGASAVPSALSEILQLLSKPQQMQ
jgi:hypothetical protein